MTYEEFKEEVKQIRLREEKAIRDLAIKYAFENNTYSIGDLVTDHAKTIRIEKFNVSGVYGSSEPQMVYTGVWLTKNREPNKKGEKHTVYSSNIQK